MAVTPHAMSFQQDNPTDRHREPREANPCELNKLEGAKMTVGRGLLLFGFIRIRPSHLNRV